MAGRRRNCKRESHHEQDSKRGGVSHRLTRDAHLYPLYSIVNSREELECTVPSIHGISGGQLIVVNVVSRLLEGVFHGVGLIRRPRRGGIRRGVDFPCTEAVGGGSGQASGDRVIRGAWGSGCNVLSQLEQHGHQRAVLKNLSSRERSVLHLWLLGNTANLPCVRAFTQRRSRLYKSMSNCANCERHDKQRE